MVLSVNTSPIYHILSEQKDNYVATEFAEGSVLQVEVAAKVANRNNACADEFLGFLLSPQAQADIAKNNVMLPVVETNIESHIDALNSRAKSMRILDTTTVTSEQLKGWINQWQKPYLSSVNELIATSAFSSLAIIWAEVRSFFHCFTLWIFTFCGFSVGSDYALSDFLKTIICIKLSPLVSGRHSCQPCFLA